MTLGELINRKKKIEMGLLGCVMVDRILGGARNQKSLNNARIAKEYKAKLVEVNRLIDIEGGKGNG